DVQARLEGAFAGVPDVTVRMDQRMGERRGATAPGPSPDRRRLERRRALTGLQRLVWEAFGVWLSS
ncbi:MAG TPA: hypothetical protein VGX21_08820, partial [Methylomirabilota bacterium]|nr:hypothetical protein [Methylomirabilota bacterium]